MLPWDVSRASKGGYDVYCFCIVYSIKVMGMCAVVNEVWVD